MTNADAEALGGDAIGIANCMLAPPVLSTRITAGAAGATVGLLHGHQFSRLLTQVSDSAVLRLLAPLPRLSWQQYHAMQM